MLEILFWTIAGLIIYTYFIYPAVMYFIGLRKRAIVMDENFRPFVTMVIAAHNEEKIIEAKLKNCLELDYPKDRLEILIGSDGSLDNTSAIVASYENKGIQLYNFKERRGKVNILNELIPKAKGEIVVFSDANTIYNPDSLKKLVRYFCDPVIGCVCGRLILEGPKGSYGGEIEGVYWKYETFLKKLEGGKGALLGANGAIYAIRRRLFETLESNTIVDDFIIPMRILQKGFKVIYEPEAMAFEEMSKSIEDEQRRKMRIGAGVYQAIFLIFPMLNIFKGFPSFAYWSHKVLRWLVPFFLIGLIIINLFLADKNLFRTLLIFQVIIYFGALMGYLSNKINHPTRLLNFLYYFVSMNFSLFIGFLRFISGRQSAAWERVER